MITLAVNKKCKAFSVHRLVLLTFIGESELHVNHKNGVKTDNRLGNLEYVSRSENAQHAMRTGLWVPHKGSKNGRAKVTEDQVREIRTMLAKGQMSKTIAERLGIKVNIVQRIKTGRSWVHVTDEL